MQGNEANYKPRFPEWNLDQMSKGELLALQRALHFWRNPSNATLKLRNAVVFRPRSNCARVKDNFWFSLAVMESRKFIDKKIGVGFRWQPQWVLLDYEIEQLGLAMIFCDFDYIEPIVNVIFDPIDPVNLNRAANIKLWQDFRTIKDVIGTRDFQDMVAENEARLSPDVYMVTSQDTGTDIIETLRGRIRDPATPARDVAALTKELTKREADRRRLFPHLGF